MPFWLLLGGASLLPAAAQSIPPAKGGGDPAYFRTEAAAQRAASTSRLGPRLARYRALSVDLTGLAAALASAPDRTRMGSAPLVLRLPLPDGTSQRFSIWVAPLLAPALARQYPGVLTYGGQGLDEPDARLSLTLSPGSLQYQLLRTRRTGDVYLEAARDNDTVHYLNYYAQDVLLPAGGAGGCGTLPEAIVSPTKPTSERAALKGTARLNFAVPVGPVLTVYRLVVETTKEYTAGRTNTAVMADVASLINNVRAIQEDELAVSMSLVNVHFYQVGADGSYDQTNSPQMIDQNRMNAETEFGVGTFDLGHLLATSGTGLAYRGTVGNPNTSGGMYTLRAGAVSGNLNRTTPSSYYSTSVIAHEMGHQFNATHVFNTSQGSCGPYPVAANAPPSPYSPISAWEPGKGSTIMAYTDGGCDTPVSNVIEARSSSYYNGGSLAQMRAYIEGIPSVGTQTASGNHPPVVSVPIDRTIPQGTPFRLTAVGSDPDAVDVLRYNWEELDLGGPANLTTPQVAGTAVPLFRSRVGTSSGAVRYFPALAHLTGTPTASDTVSEQLPTVARPMSLRCTVRDDHKVGGTAVAASTVSNVVGGLVQSRTVVLTVSAANATPFAVLSPSLSGISWSAGSTQTVTWNGVGTRSSAVNCQTVNVRLSLDGGKSYPTLLAAGVANVDDASGTVSFTVPNVTSTSARVMVEAADNYFFDISDNPFTITAGVSPVLITSLSPTSGPAGTLLTLSGAGFGTSATGLSISVGGVAAPIQGTVTDARVSVSVPASALTGPVVATVTGRSTGNGTASGGLFQVSPVLSGVSPATGPVGAAYTLSGYSFGGATRVSFNGTETRSFTLNTTNALNTLSGAVPLGATTGAVVVYTAGGASNSDIGFTVVPFLVSSVSPALNTGAGSSGPIFFSFNAPVSAASVGTQPLLVNSFEAGGRLPVGITTSGSTLSASLSAPPRAGELISYTLLASTSSTAGAALPQAYVGQYNIRTRARLSQQGALNLATGTHPNQVLSGDLNGDGFLDLLSVNTAAGTLSVLLNNGSGTGFSAAPGSPITVGANPRGAALADFNNDGKLDVLVASNGGSGTLTLLPGLGTGEFSPALSITSAGAVQNIAVGDVNGDGLLDFVSAQAYTNVGRATVGLGTGSFSSAASAFTISTYDGLDLTSLQAVLADVNEDGRLDLISANSSGSVSYRLGDGQGGFSGGANLPAAGANALAVADFTGDGHLDLAVTCPTAAGAPFLVWLGNGTGTFGPNPNFTLSPSGGGFAYTLSAADYDGDGVQDLIAPRSAFPTDAGVDVFSYNAATNSFSVPVIVTSQGMGSSPNAVRLVDLNNDRTLDFALANPAANGLSVALTSPGALPVELVSFEGVRQSDGTVALRWQTASERANAGFIVERSLDGQVFASLSALLPGHGSSSSAQAYGYVDRTAPGSALYYRLHQLDVDGQSAFAPPVRVAPALELAPALLVYPNPGRQQVSVQLTGVERSAEMLVLVDPLGREVRRLPAPMDNTPLRLSLRDLPAGLYIVRCGRLSQQLVVE